MNGIPDQVVLVTMFSLWGLFAMFTAFFWGMSFHDDSWRPDLFALYLALLGAAVAVAIGFAIVLYLLRLLGLL